MGKLIVQCDIMQKEKSQTAADFKEIKSLGISIFVSEQNADYADTMRILAEKGLRPLNYREALIHISKTQELKDQLKMKWLYLNGNGDIEDNGMHAFNEQGKLAPLTGKETYEQKVLVLIGNHSLSLFIYSDVVAAYSRRFDLVTLNIRAPVVVGVKKDDAAIKITPEVVSMRRVFLPEPPEVAVRRVFI